MTVLRSDIESALDDLISNEEGMRFQGLAVVLAKQRWPDFIASERKKDLGADAIAKASFAAKGFGKVLACSLTATRAKIRSDAAKIKQNFPDVTKLVFATPDTVTNQKSEPWAAEIQSDFGYELAIMPREDIITSLMDPSNTSLCQTHLGLSPPLPALDRAASLPPDLSAIGVYHAKAILHGTFLYVVRIGGDGQFTTFECSGIRVRRGAPEQDMTESRVKFRLYVAEAEPSTFRFRGSPNLRAWIEGVETEPRVILLVKQVRSTMQKYWMLAVHDWLISQASKERLFDWGLQPEFTSKDFQETDVQADRFHQKMREEAARAGGVQGAKWRTLRDYGLIPVDELTLLEHMKFARFWGIPTKVFQHLTRRTGGRVPSAVKDYLFSGVEPEDPEVATWRRLVLKQASLYPSTGLEPAHFRRFARLLTRPKSLIRLPPFRIAPVNIWRAFVSTYPESVHGLSNLVAHSSDPPTVAFAAALLPSLALSEDRQTHQLAWQALQGLDSRMGDFRSYYVRRELLRTPAEASGDKKYVQKAIAFLKREGASGAERRYLSGYGWTPEIVPFKLNQKREHPTIRDETLLEYFEAIGEILL